MTASVVFSPLAARQIQRERAWLYDNRGRERADAFEAELAHFLDLVAECPAMGDPAPPHPNDRHWYLRRSGFHVYYRLRETRDAVLVIRIRHHAQRPLKR